ncbi:helix-turn-helix domain-containing protein [Streptomyces beijiangensis]|uniref:XRE family transcriptional regulator n=1 Tax=Streptomyces beijiangensis TaxID=163361 RepID=A0A939JKU1_9ACTN|nr:XRE family transcriptional regulator [Streptomyces beijiangensis]MBO0515660.1 XRE family transcriptional regulator [Streptomyces beijiangensis]
MPRWKALPEELDPQVREFASQLRRLVDRSGLSIAAVADRTGYSKTSWERYLNGRLLAPKGAIVALAEVTGTNPVHLTTMWELAERAWSRSEARHDMTMEAIRISQARAALGEFGSAPVAPARAKNGSARPQGAAAEAAPAPAPVADAPVAPTPIGEFGPPPGGPYQSPPPPPPTPSPSPSPSPSRQPGGRTPPSDQGRRRRKLMMFLAGVVGALLVIAAAVLLTDLGGKGDNKADDKKNSPSPTVSVNPNLPAGVKCSGKDCTGKDPEAMGCGGELATSVSNVTVGGRLVEVRYSKTCGAAWARINQAATGDVVQVSVAGAATQKGTVAADPDAYTPMTASTDPSRVKACATLANGARGCTKN